jgi:cytochrome c biogenesis factor
MDTLINFCLFEERARDAITQLIEEKHRLMNRCRLYEVSESNQKSVGITSRATGDTYMHHLQYWQDENEQLTLKISDLKVRTKR